MYKFRCICIAFALLSLFNKSECSFIYGQPCSVRNTAYLFSNKWTMPQNNAKVDCVDMTGFKKPNASILPEFFKGISTADTLYADHMNLTRFPVIISHNIPHLRLLDLSGNGLKKIPLELYRIVPKLEKLLLSENRIRIHKRKPLTYSNSLKTLMLSNNKIKAVYKITFSKLPRLEVLYLDRNNLKKIDPSHFKVMPNLKYLHIGQNSIMKVPPKNLMPHTLIHYISKDQQV